MLISGLPISGGPISGTPGAGSFTFHSLWLSSTAGMVVGDSIEIMLDNGEFFKTTIKEIITAGQILITTPLPYRATAGNIVNDLTQNTVVAASRAELSTDLGG